MHWKCVCGTLNHTPETDIYKDYCCNKKCNKSCRYGALRVIEVKLYIKKGKSPLISNHISCSHNESMVEVLKKHELHKVSVGFIKCRFNKTGRQSAYRSENRKKDFIIVATDMAEPTVVEI